jgi:uncharacterized membrane protein YsdA (DUF1294 family)
MIAWAATIWGALNIGAWALFRFDKWRAGRGARRIPERTLFVAVAVGAIGAMLAMYAHARRHKVDKRGFVWRAWTLAGLHVFLVGAAGGRLLA